MIRFSWTFKNKFYNFSKQQVWDIKVVVEKHIFDVTEKNKHRKSFISVRAVINRFLELNLATKNYYVPQEKISMKASIEVLVWK